jgi:hypothetical protein
VGKKVSGDTGKRKGEGRMGRACVKVDNGESDDLIV